MKAALDFGPAGFRDGTPVVAHGDQHNPLTAVARNEDLLVLLAPAQRIGPNEWAPAEYQVWRVEPGHVLGDKVVTATLVLGFPARPTTVTRSSL